MSSGSSNGSKSSRSHTNRHSKATLNKERTRRQRDEALRWLRMTYEECQGDSVSREDMHAEYLTSVGRGADSLSSALLGKSVRVAFPAVQTRRLGPRDSSRYHYANLRRKTKASHDTARKRDWKRNSVSTGSTVYSDKNSVIGSPESDASTVSWRTPIVSPARSSDDGSYRRTRRGSRSLGSPNMVALPPAAAPGSMSTPQLLHTPPFVGNDNVMRPSMVASEQRPAKLSPMFGPEVSPSLPASRVSIVSEDGSPTTTWSHSFWSASHVATSQETPTLPVVQELPEADIVPWHRETSWHSQRIKLETQVVESDERVTGLTEQLGHLNPATGSPHAPQRKTTQARPVTQAVMARTMRFTLGDSPYALPPASPIFGYHVGWHSPQSPPPLSIDAEVHMEQINGTRKRRPLVPQNSPSSKSPHSEGRPRRRCSITRQNYAAPMRAGKRGGQTDSSLGDMKVKGEDNFCDTTSQWTNSTYGNSLNTSPQELSSPLSAHACDDDDDDGLRFAAECLSDPDSHTNHSSYSPLPGCLTPPSLMV